MEDQQQKLQVYRMPTTVLQNGMELVETESYKGLNVLEREVAIAVVSPRISTIEPTDFILLMNRLIIQTHAKTGFKIDGDIHDGTIDELCSDLQKYKSALTFPEIEIAFNRGYKKEYGEYFGLNSATYFKWISAYYLDKSRIKAKDAVFAAAQKNDEQLTLEEREKEIKSGVLKCFKTYVDKKEIWDIGNITYDYLYYNKKLIKLSKEEKYAIAAHCKDVLSMEKVQSVIRPQDVKRVNDEIANINDGKSTALVSASKRMALAKYFDELISFDRKIEELID